MSRNKNRNKPKAPQKDEHGVPVPKGDRITFQTDGAGPIGKLEFVEGRFNFTGAFTASAKAFFGLLKSQYIDPYVRRRLGFNKDVSKLKYRLFSERAVCPGCNKKREGVSVRITSPKPKKGLHHVCSDCLLKAILAMEDFGG